LRHLPPSVDDPDLIVSLETADDAGVYRLREDLALVQTVDFFTPVVDDPYVFGQVAVANALSDIYAMGGVPLTAMNVVGFPVGKLDMSVLAEILKGGHAKLQEAGAVLLGGHSVQDNEPKYGVSLTGIVHPDKVLTNSGAKPGDFLVLTKPLGIGIITTAIKRGVVPEETLQRVSMVMTALNNTASQAAVKVGVNACTDITGFGLLGHTYELAKASNVGVVIEAGKVPVIEETWEYVAQNIVPGGTRANLKYLEPVVEFDREITEDMKLVLADAITSGGLLVSVKPENLDSLLAQMTGLGTLEAAVIGRVVRDTPGKISVRK